MNPLIPKFLSEVSKVISTPTLRPRWFEPRVGLCSNFDRWLVTQSLIRPSRDVLSLEFHNLMLQHMGKETISTPNPFNTDQTLTYCEEARTGKLYSNPNRLAFINKHKNENTPMSTNESQTPRD